MSVGRDTAALRDDRSTGDYPHVTQFSLRLRGLREQRLLPPRKGPGGGTGASQDLAQTGDATTSNEPNDVSKPVHGGRELEDHDIPPGIPESEQKCQRLRLKSSGLLRKFRGGMRTFALLAACLAIPTRVSS